MAHFETSKNTHRTGFSTTDDLLSRLNKCKVGSLSFEPEISDWPVVAVQNGLMITIWSMTAMCLYVSPTIMIGYVSCGINSQSTSFLL